MEAQLSPRIPKWSKADDGDAYHEPTTEIGPRVGDGKAMYTVTEFILSDRDTETEFIVMCNGKRLLMRLSANNISESHSLKDQYLSFLRVTEGFELEGYTADDFYG